MSLYILAGHPTSDPSGHVMQETNTPSDDPVHLRSLATVRSDSYRQRSQSRSGTDDSPQIASHKKSCKCNSARPIAIVIYLFLVSFADHTFVHFMRQHACMVL